MESFSGVKNLPEVMIIQTQGQTQRQSPGSRQIARAGRYARNEYRGCGGWHAMAQNHFTLTELWDAWPSLSGTARVEGFESLQRDDAESFFLQLNVRERANLVLGLPAGERRLWMRLLAPDDAADLIQEAAAEARAELLALLDDGTQREVKGLLDYAEDDAGGLMNTALLPAPFGYDSRRGDQLSAPRCPNTRANDLLRLCRRP